MIKKYQNEIIAAITENLFYGLVIVDQQGFITHLNKNYCQFLQVSQSEAVGKHVTEVIENTRMHHVINTEEPELFHPQYVRGNYMVANRVPLFSNGKMIGAVGVVLFRDMHDLSTLNSEIKHLLTEVEFYRNELKKQTGIKYFIHDIIGSSEEILTIKQQIKKIAPSDITVLITGESGTGKELIAHSIHQLSNRSDKPFISVNCAAIPEDLFESELFGYEAGAFTGAKTSGKEGKFQLAEGGTLFLDEIGDMPLNSQVKLLRVLQENEIQTLGGTAAYQINVRIIVATNRPLEALVAENLFREDLYYRVNMINFHLPPLRKRRNDIKILANYLLSKTANKMKKRVTSFSDEIITLFLSYHWPGNIRELENVIQTAVLLTDSETIELEDLSHLPIIQSTKHDINNLNLSEVIKKAEKETISKVLKIENHKKKAAKILGISPSTLYEKIKEYQL